MAEYLIQEETLTAIADKIREYEIPPVGDGTHEIDPDFIMSLATEDQPGQLTVEDIQVYYYENFDDEGFTLDFYTGDTYHGGIEEYTYLENNKGNVVPVVFLSENVGTYTEPCFYEGVETIQDVAYDKWRRIETTDSEGNDPVPENYTWDSDCVAYIYTTRIVVSGTSSDSIPVPEFPDRIEGVYNQGLIDGLNRGLDTSDATAEPGHILIGETAYVDGEKVTGTMPDNGSVKPAELAAGDSYTIPEGYHNGAGKVSAKSLASQTDGTATSHDLMYGETAWVDGHQITGDIINQGAKTKTLDTTTTSYTIPEGYHNGAGKVSITTETKTVTPSTTTQSITPSTGKVLSSVTVNAVPTVARANTVMSTTVNSTNATATITASNDQSTGYVEGSEETTTATVALSANGAKVTATINDGDKINAIEKSVATAARAATTLTSAVENSTLKFTATNSQTTGYVTADTTKNTATKTVSLTASGRTVTASDGTNSISKSIATGQVTVPQTDLSITPTISVDSAGKITVSGENYTTVSPTITAGYVSSGTGARFTASTSGTEQLETQGAAEITPGTSSKPAVAAGKYTTGAVTVKGDANLISGNIKSGVSIFGVNGSYSGASLSDSTADATATANDILASKTAYVKGTKVTGKIVTRDDSDITVGGCEVSGPSGYYPEGIYGSVDLAIRAPVTITTTNNNTTGQLTIRAVNDQSEGYINYEEDGYQSAQTVVTLTQTDPFIDLINNKIIASSTMKDSSSAKTVTKSSEIPLTTKEATIYTPTTSDQTIASKTYLTGVQTIKGDANLTAENIKSGVSIFGVSGSHVGGITESDQAKIDEQAAKIQQIHALVKELRYAKSPILKISYDSDLMAYATLSWNRVRGAKYYILYAYTGGLGTEIATVYENGAETIREATIYSPDYQDTTVSVVAVTQELLDKQAEVGGVLWLVASSYMDWLMSNYETIQWF